jgi:hypothetical protein
MKTLVKITDVLIFIGLVDEAQMNVMFQMKKTLDDNNIKYGIQFHPDNLAHPQLLENLSSWVFGTEFKQYKLTSLPLVMWREYYDDYDVVQEIVQNLSELKASTLMQKKGLVV